MGKQFICEYCGNVIYRRDSGHNYKYCSMSCRQNARFGPVIQDEIVSARNPLCIEAIKLCQSGLNKREAARRVGIKEHIITQWFHKYGSANNSKIFAGRVCQHCGKSLEGMPQLSIRKYCSKTCSERERYAQRRLLHGSKRKRSDPELRAKALELYCGGLGQAAIAQHFGISVGTVSSWTTRFRGQRGCLKTSSATQLMPLKQQLQKAETADEWLRALRAFAHQSPLNCEPSPVRLVCGVTNGQSEANQLVTIITECLRLNPMSGEIFAFCNKGKNTITTITWKGTMFNIVGLPRLYGRYLWPHENLGLSIQVSEHEFDFLISCYKRSHEMRKNAEYS